MASWHEENQRYLMDAIAQIRSTLKNHIDPKADVADKPVPAVENWSQSVPPALERLCQLFRLSNFERNVLLLCAGMEFDSGWANLCGEAQGNPNKPYPTFALALTLFPGSPWGAITAAAPLRRLHMVEIGEGNALTACPLRLDERILNFLAGIQQLDQRLFPLMESLPNLERLVNSHQEIADQVAASWLQASLPFPVVQLCGDDTVSKKAIAMAACTQVKLNLLSLSASLLPTNTDDLNLLRILWEREWALSDTALLLDCDELDENVKESNITRLIETLNCPVVIISRDRRRQRQRPILSFDVTTPTIPEQRVLWRQELGDAANLLNGHLDRLVAQFNLAAPAIRAAHTKAVGYLSKTINEPEQKPVMRGVSLADMPDTLVQQHLPDALWTVCRTQARPRLDDLAQRVDTVATWENLILPDREKQVLRTLTAQVKNRTAVYESWGFSSKSKRGLGVSALFAGESGTGKTMAAEVIAQTLNLDLYRIDLSSVVSKYIGETEKNLRRLFDAAEGSGVILLFDEADSLFGKRSEVKDSHDRHANIEVSYLLQRMEAYRGLAILTTNLKGSLDQAFLRRIRFIVQFPFPDAEQREAIWRHVFPQRMPTQDLHFGRLAKLSVAGGNIRSIALNAAFLAMDENQPVQMQHILQAAQSEYIKLERPLTDREVKGWIQEKT